MAPYTRLFTTFLDLIAGRPVPADPPPATFADGLAGMQVLDAIRRSAREQRWVAIPGKLEHLDRDGDLAGLDSGLGRLAGRRRAVRRDQQREERAEGHDGRGEQERGTRAVDHRALQRVGERRDLAAVVATLGGV